MADPVELRMKFKSLGESLGLAGTDLISYINTEVDKHEAKAEREAEREARRAEREERAKERDAEREARQHELELKRLENANSSSASSSLDASQSDYSAPRQLISGMAFSLSPFSEKEESLDLYLSRFERLAAENQLEPKHWVSKLCQGLRGKAYELYIRIPSDQATEYDEVKKALLKGFELTGECYRRKFRTNRKEKGENYAQFSDRLSTLLDKWVSQSASSKTYDELTQLLVWEQLRETMSPELRTFAVEQGADSLRDLVKVADRYVSAHAEAKSVRRDHKPNTRESNPRSPTREEHAGNRRANFRLGQNKGPSPGAASQSPAELKRYCSFCHRRNHNTEDCFKRAAKLRHEKETKTSHQVVTQSSGDTSYTIVDHPSVTETVTVNSQTANCLYDTGLSYDAIVRETLVSPVDITDETVDLQGADLTQTPATCRIAWIDVTSRYVTGRIRAAVLKKPLYDLILGCRYVFLGTPPHPVEVAAVQTRAQAKNQETQPEPALNPMPAEIKTAQRADNSLAKCFQKLPKAHAPPHKGEFYVEDGILHRQGDGDHTQLVLPTTYRPQVLELGHSMPLSGHMGVGATVQRISAHYYWPGITEDVKRYVKSCHQCQKFSPRHHTVPVTLGPTVVVGVPFQKVSVDIVGPLPMTKKKNRFLLTLVDACSMWCEAVPLPAIDTRKIADALIAIFTRVGFPESIRTDNGSQFTGRMMQEVFELLQVHHIRTPPYHPASNGQVERLNGTLLTILRKVADDNPEAWDTYVNTALFAYRETPHATTGYTPSTLLFGRPLSGPLEALRRSWTDAKVDDTPKGATKYVADLQETLKATWTKASEALKKARARQAKYYNRHAKDRELQVGDQVLLLLPSGTHKLDIAWRGPYTVTAKKSRTVYQVDVNGKVRTHHINLLKKYTARPVSPSTPHLLAVALAEEVESSEIDAVEYPLTSKETYKDVVLNPSLTADQRRQVTTVIQELQTVLTDRPGRTDLVEVTLTVTDPTPVRQKPYPMPLAKQQAIKEEVDALLQAGIISPSLSPYSAGTVLLRKPSGEHRLCIDFRQLNAVTQFQPEPLPDPATLFAKLQTARYFSRIDLTKGYYQIPVPPHVRPYLAFSTMEGHFEFNVLPFGLHNAPSIFSAMMRKLLAPLACEHLQSFMDDILVATPTWNEHITLLRKLLTRLKDTGLTARPTKCQIGFEQLEFLGHTISHGCLQPLNKTVQRLLNAPRPKTKKDVQSFLGLCGFYQKFIPNYNSIAVPLTDATKKTAPDSVVWTAECEAALQMLKDKMTSPPVLHLPDLTQPFVLRTDASDKGLGAVLLQRDPSDPDTLFPVVYASRKLRTAETHYATSEKECLGLVWAVQKFQMYLYGTHFTVQVDHRPLSFLAASKSLNARLMRWALLLQTYSFRVEYIPGKENHGADYLSRHPVKDISAVATPSALRASAPEFVPTK